MLKTVLHLGVHRCATTSFQADLDQNADALASYGIAVWTPKRTRTSLFTGLVRPPEAETVTDLAKEKVAGAIIRAEHDALAARGVRNLVVSEENMIGTPKDNLARGALYPHLPQRLARFVRAFGARIDHLGICIRSYEDYWASVLAYTVASGGDVPSREQAEKLAHQPRSWSMIIDEVARAVPQAKITVWTFDAFAGRSRRQFGLLTGRSDAAGLFDKSPHWKNTSRNCNKLRHILKTRGCAEMAKNLPRGVGAWMPFDALEQAVMRAQYADDLSRLRRADPQITFHETTAMKVSRKMTKRLTGHDKTGGHHETTRQMV